MQMISPNWLDMGLVNAIGKFMRQRVTVGQEAEGVEMGNVWLYEVVEGVDDTEDGLAVEVLTRMIGTAYFSMALMLQI
jgi:hypothetical protein